MALSSGIVAPFGLAEHGGTREHQRNLTGFRSGLQPIQAVARIFLTVCDLIEFALLATRISMRVASRHDPPTFRAALG